MKMDTDSLPVLQMPSFITEASDILTTLKTMDYYALKKLWNCSDSIAQLNYLRLQESNLTKWVTPALFAYEGLQYNYMAPDVFDESAFHYLENHLRILSGLYGVLRPFDAVIPYRLEMQAKLVHKGFENLYAFWDKKLADHLSKETDVILNLASKEYSKIIKPHLPKHVSFVTCDFCEIINEELISKGTLCKMARGEMVRFMADHKILTPEGLKEFNGLGFQYSEKSSIKDNYVFIKQQSKAKRNEMKC